MADYGGVRRSRVRGCGSGAGPGVGRARAHHDRGSAGGHVVHRSAGRDSTSAGGNTMTATTEVVWDGVQRGYIPGDRLDIAPGRSLHEHVIDRVDPVTF